jgi:hypothetical protein
MPELDIGTKTARLVILAQKLADQTPLFFETKGPGVGDRAANEFTAQLSRIARELFGHDFSQAKICGKCGFTVDFYIPDEQTVVEFTFGLDKPMSEFERDIFKCLLAKDNDNHVQELVLVSKPGGIKKLEAPGPMAIRRWVREKHGLEIEVLELQRPPHGGQ